MSQGFGSQLLYYISDQCLKLWKFCFPPVKGLGLASDTATQPIVFTPSLGKEHTEKELDLTATRFRSSNFSAEPHTNVVQKK